MPISLLIVEDDAEASGMMRALIAMKVPGVAIYLADSGSTGLQISRERAPDIVITDINMPGMDGIEMAAQITTMKPDTRFIVVSGYSDKEKDFAGIPVHDYLVKPTDFRKLLAAIEACIGEIAREKP